MGKEAIAINLKNPDGQKLLHRLINELKIDIFCSNTMPARHQPLGFDYDTLKKVKQDLIWCSVSAMGLAYPDVPGYDPVLQAYCGYMDLTGHPDGPPLQCGPPLIDLRAGDEAFIQIILAIMEKQNTGRGKKIDISMAQTAVSWLHTFLPMLDMGSPPEELKRSGNEHRQFIPVNAYPTADGHLFIAIGNDRQWQRLTELPAFQQLQQEVRRTNAGRHAERAAIHREMAEATQGLTSAALMQDLARQGIPHAPINSIRQVREMEAIAAKLTTTRTPGGARVHLPPPAVDLEGGTSEYSFAPRYSEHTESVLQEAGLKLEEITALREGGIVP